MRTSESIAELQKALAAFRQEIKQPAKDANNPFFKSKYVPLENVVEAIDKVASTHGLAYVQEAYTEESGMTSVVTRMTHSSGEWIETRPLTLRADKDNAQGQGSAITYARRYQLSALFGTTSDEDDDGNQAVKTMQNRRKSAPAISAPAVQAKCSKCNKDIKPQGGASISQIVDKSIATFGKPVCVNCWNKIINAEKETALPEEVAPTPEPPERHQPEVDLSWMEA